MKKVLLSAFTDLAQDALLTYAKNVVTSMTANPIFVKLMPDVEELRDLNLAYSKALESNVSGGKSATAEKNKAKTLVSNQLKKSGYVCFCHGRWRYYHHLGCGI
jgi:dihydroorotate dehydrogenase